MFTVSEYTLFQLECYIGLVFHAYIEPPTFGSYRASSVTISGRKLLCAIRECELPLCDCDLNSSMQHLNSSYRDGDVEYEVQNEDLLLKRTEGIDVGSVAARRFYAHHSSSF